MLNQSSHWEQWEPECTASCSTVSSWQICIDIHPYPHTSSICSLIENQMQLPPSAHLSAVLCMWAYVCVCVYVYVWSCVLYSKCIITRVQEILCLILEMVNACLIQLDSQPPFESSLHSQLWGAAHRGSQKHLQSWNGVWDLCSDYTGTSRVHILSHDSPCQCNSSPLFGCNPVTLGFKVWLSRKQSS